MYKRNYVTFLTHNNNNTKGYNKRANVDSNLSTVWFWKDISLRTLMSFFNLNRKLSKSKKPLHMLLAKMWYFASRVHS